EYFEALMDKYFKREDYAADLTFEKNFDDGTPQISDNDGLWTAEYVASQCLRFAVTGENDAAEKARRSMRAMMKLVDVTGIPGFPARAYRRPGEDNYGDNDIEWRKSSDETGDLEWKGETSSDETVGHFYAASMFYDLVADDKEKKEITAYIKGIADHILSHDYTLRDVDGLPTTWAFWGPDELNGDDKRIWERGTNSLEILSFLNTAHRMTGDKKYRDEYEKLIKKHHYAMNLMRYKLFDNHACHIDDFLDILCIHCLLMYEDDPQLRKYYLTGFKKHFEEERIEKCPIFDFIYGGLTNEPCDVEYAVKTLSDAPLDTINYDTKNSVRPDVIKDDSTVKFGGRIQAKYPLPIDERPMGRIYYNAFNLDMRGYENTATCPSTWLFSYWLGRYYDLFEEM
nr:hypothetical protein [Clostridiales bacterium]